MVVKIVCDIDDSPVDDDCSSDEIATKVSWIASIVVSLVFFVVVSL